MVSQTLQKIKQVGILVWGILLLNSCLKDEHPFQELDSIEAVYTADGWEVSKPSNEGMDEQALLNVYRKIHSEAEFWQLRSLLVFRNERLLAEHYFKTDRDYSFPKPIWSCTKQVVAILTGCAIEKGLISSVDESLDNLLPEAIKNHPDKASIKLSDLLTMRSGFDFDEAKDVSALLQRKPENALDFILSKDLLFEPGSEFRYNSGETHLIAAAIQNRAGKPLREWGWEVLFNEIGFRTHNWMKYNGYNFGGFGISTTPRDLAKISQLVLNKGQWKGKQLVDSNWIKQMISTQTITHENSDYTFGYLWWIHEQEGMVFMAGSGGQFACIIPSLNMMVVMTSEHDTDKELELGFEDAVHIVKQITATVL